jgi:hypothetical protein
MTYKSTTVLILKLVVTQRLIYFKFFSTLQRAYWQHESSTTTPTSRHIVTFHFTHRPLGTLESQILQPILGVWINPWSSEYQLYSLVPDFALTYMLVPVTHVQSSVLLFRYCVRSDHLVSSKCGCSPTEESVTYYFFTGHATQFQVLTSDSAPHTR